MFTKPFSLNYYNICVYGVMWCLLQGHLSWIARGSIGYQNWFYPHTNADYLLYSSYGPKADRVFSYFPLILDPFRMDKHWNVYSQLPEIQHFQPQLSPHRQCVAEICQATNTSTDSG